MAVREAAAILEAGARPCSASEVACVLEVGTGPRYTSGFTTIGRFVLDDFEPTTFAVVNIAKVIVAGLRRCSPCRG